MQKTEKECRELKRSYYFANDFASEGKWGYIGRRRESTMEFPAWKVWLPSTEAPVLTRRIAAASALALLGCVYWPNLSAQVDSKIGDCPGRKPCLLITAPYKTTLGEPFQFELQVVPPADQPVSVEFEPNGIQYSKPSLTLKPQEHAYLTATVLTAHDGVAWIHAHAPDYPDRFFAINAGFLGHMEPTTQGGRLAYKTATTLTLSLFDKEHKPFSADSPLKLHIESSDAILTAAKEHGPLELVIRPGDTVSPQFQVTSTSLRGGIIHLNATLAVNDHQGSLDSEAFTLPADPATWLPISLAVCGGLLCGLYRILSSASFRKAHTVGPAAKILVTSAVAGFVGYLVADFDLLGLKLDPTVLRTYPLLGFVVAYLGIDLFMKSYLPPKPNDSTP